MPRNLGGGDEVARAIVSKTITEYADNNITKVGSYAFYACNQLTFIDLPLVKDIGNYAFYNCSRLKSVVIPSVWEIKESGFSACTSLKTVDLSVDVYIRDNAFTNCNNLKAIILRSETMSKLFNTNVFDGCYHFLGTAHTIINPTGAKDGYIYVPSALVESYKTASNWSEFATQFRALEDYTVDGTITGALDETKI